MWKGTKLFSIFNFKCPKCHEGELFINKNPYKLNQLALMHEKCNHCGLKYENETGFFYGAMYVSYAFTVAWSVAVFVAQYVISLLLGYSVNLVLYIVILGITMLILGPYLFRLSRATWLNFFNNYEKK
jgi:uncharacterized protein (DUF983 family)